VISVRRALPHQVAGFSAVAQSATHLSPPKEHALASDFSHVSGDLLEHSTQATANSSAHMNARGADGAAEITTKFR
jgi:hypothetical protein